MGGANSNRGPIILQFWAPRLGGGSYLHDTGLYSRQYSNYTSTPLSKLKGMSKDRPTRSRSHMQSVCLQISLMLPALQEEYNYTCAVLQ